MSNHVSWYFCGICGQLTQNFQYFSYGPFLSKYPEASAPGLGYATILLGLWESADVFESLVGPTLPFPTFQSPETCLFPSPTQFLVMLYLEFDCMWPYIVLIVIFGLVSFPQLNCTIWGKSWPPNSAVTSTVLHSVLGLQQFCKRKRGKEGSEWEKTHWNLSHLGQRPLWKQLYLNPTVKLYIMYLGEGENLYLYLYQAFG